MKKIETAKGKKVRATRHGRRGSAEDWLELIEEHYEHRQTETKREETKTLRKEGIYDNMACAEKGRVIGVAGRSWIVLPDKYNEPITCVAAGTMQSPNADSSLIAVGDSAYFTRNTAGECSIIAIDERVAKLARRGVGKAKREQIIIANAEQLIIVMAAAEPFYNRRLIDRYLIAAEKGQLDPIICINKIELMPMDIVREDLKVYEKLKIPTLYVSASTNIGIEELHKKLCGKISVFSGPSGVGKSSLTNKLLGREVQRVDSLNEKFGKGKHVTTAAEMFALPNGGFIADTPGLREFAIWDMSREEIPFYFHDFDRYFRKCKFNSCLHLHEPGCAVQRAVAAGRIDYGRYQSYVNISASLDD